MKKYEVLFLINPEISDDELQNTVNKLRSLIEAQQGEIVKMEDWGKRRLAYRVQKHSKGHYFLIHFNGNSAILSEIERFLRFNESIMKFIIVKATKDSDIPPPEEHEEVHEGV